LIEPIQFKLFCGESSPEFMHRASLSSRWLMCRGFWTPHVLQSPSPMTLRMWLNLRVSSSQTTSIGFWPSTNSSCWLRPHASKSDRCPVLLLRLGAFVLCFGPASLCGAHFVCARVIRFLDPFEPSANLRLSQFIARGSLSGSGCRVWASTKHTSCSRHHFAGRGSPSRFVLRIQPLGSYWELHARCRFSFQTQCPPNWPRGCA